uniref:arginine--tRNA ligase n=1 Tax=Setaria italica TaxID=4555 RepID=K3XRJ5_SETIT
MAGWLPDQNEKKYPKTSHVGFGLVLGYADLKNNRLTDYTFSYEKMLSDKNAAITFVHADERALGLHLIRFQEVVEQACTDLFPHYLCDYLYCLSEAFSKFYASCQWSDHLKKRAVCCFATRRPSSCSSVSTCWASLQSTSYK